MTGTSDEDRLKSFHPFPGFELGSFSAKFQSLSHNPKVALTGFEFLRLDSGIIHTTLFLVYNFCLHPPAA